MSARVRPVALALAVLVLAAPVAFQIAAAREAQAATTKTVAMKENYFSPKTVTIAKGSKIKWVNKGDAAHTTTGSGWNKVLSPGQSWTRTFKAKGTFKYKCTFHSGMTGTIKVT